MKSKIKSLFGAFLALILSTTSALAAITIRTENLTLEDAYVGKMYDIWLYWGFEDEENIFDGVSDDYTIQVKDGTDKTLPAGLQVRKWSGDKSAELYGTLNATGTHQVEFTVTDGDDSVDFVVTFSVKNAPIAVVSGILPTAFTGVEASIPLAGTVKGGEGTYSFALTEGSLPDGLILNNGVITGVPTAIGTSYFTITVTDPEKSSLDPDDLEYIAPLPVNYALEVKGLASKEYLDASGTSQTANCIVLDAGTTTLNAGWYVVDGTLSYKRGTSLTVSGEVNLILAAGSSLTVSGTSSTAGIVVTSGSTLNIFGQTAGSGSLTVSGGLWGAGIGGGNGVPGGTVKIYGGTVKATGGSSAAGIGGGRNAASQGTLIIGSNMMANSSTSTIADLDPAAALARNETTGEVALDGNRYWFVAAAQAVTRANIIYMDGDARLEDLEPATYVEGKGVSTLPTPAKAGYTFSHWSTAAGSGGTVVHGISDSATGDQTIYAKWAAIKYTITYMNGVSVIEGLFPSNYFASATYSLPSRLSDLPTGARFDGWYEDSAFSGAKVTEIPANSTTGNKTFYAKIFYPISYYDGDTPIANLELASYVVSSEDLPLPDPTAPSGKTFAGWYTDAELTDGPVAVIIAGSTGAKTFYAKWDDAIVPKISIDFIDADGNPANEDCQIINKPITTLNDGWYAVNGEVDYGDSSIKVVGDVHLVLFDGARLSVTNVSSGAAIEVTSGNSLSIYGQMRGTGIVDVKGGSSSAGIGGSGSAASCTCGTVNIYGGTVTAKGGSGGAGIGGGWEGNGGDITVKGGMVMANGGTAQGIGGGYNAASHGSLTVAAGIGVCSSAVEGSAAHALSIDSETFEVDIVPDPEIPHTQTYFLVSPKGSIVYMDGESPIVGLEPGSYTVGVVTALPNTVSSDKPGYKFAGWYEKYGSSPVTAIPASATGTQTFYAQWTPIEYTVTYKKGASTLDLNPATYTVETSPILRKLPSTVYADPGKEFVGWCSDAGLTSDLVSSIPVDSTGNLTYYAKFRNITTDPISVDFVAADGSPMNETCQVLVRGMRYLDAEWYVVTNDLFLSDTLTIEGNVNLVLVDGVELTVVSTVDRKSAVTVASGCSLTIWGQTEGTGELDAWASSSYSDGCGIEGKYGGSGVNITINGGTVTATGNQGAAGIGNCINASGITVTINGGTVTATGGSKGAGIGGGSARSGATVIINGGTVTASGGIGDDDFFGSGIGGGAIASNHGTLTVGSGMEVKAGATMNPTTELTPDSEGRVTLSGERFYVIKEKATVEDWPADTSTVAGQTAGEAFEIAGDLAGVNAKTLADWAKGNGSVPYADRNGIITDAYLLNCANTAESVAAKIEDAEEAIKITAISFNELGEPVLTIKDNRTSYGNGTVVVEGAASLAAPIQWHDKTSGDKFFRTKLVPKLVP